MPHISVKIVNPALEQYLSQQGAHSPLHYATPESAGLDLMACIQQPLRIEPNQKAILIPTGFAIDINNPNICAVIAPRSGLGHKAGLILGNTIGIIDSDYLHEIFISAWCRSNQNAEPLTIQPFERIAQLLFLPVLRPTFQLQSSISRPTSRLGGFGSTGSAGTPTS